MKNIKLTFLSAFLTSTALHASNQTIEIAPDEVIKGVVLPYLNNEEVGRDFGFTSTRYYNLTEQELAERLLTASPEELADVGNYRGLLHFELVGI